MPLKKDYNILKRLFDLVLSIIGLIILSPVFLFISILIIFDSGLPILYKARRVGLNKAEFNFLKFRTMILNSDDCSITVGDNDPRITHLGFFLRKYKLDELPQLFNVLTGSISFVGPRADVAKYTKYYEMIYKDYYKIKPGITSYSSIYFSNESELYVKTDDPEYVYITQTIPKKVELDKKYFNDKSLLKDFKILEETICKLIRGNEK
jgi:lipopolysaccharide/colanic/teichoic acid biosynthesis glycosyltransferase